MSLTLTFLPGSCTSVDSWASSWRPVEIGGHCWQLTRRLKRQLTKKNRNHVTGRCCPSCPSCPLRHCSTNCRRCRNFRTERSSAVVAALTKPALPSGRWGRSRSRPCPSGQPWQPRWPRRCCSPERWMRRIDFRFRSSRRCSSARSFLQTNMKIRNNTVNVLGLPFPIELLRDVGWAPRDKDDDWFEDLL